MCFNPKIQYFTTFILQSEINITCIFRGRQLCLLLCFLIVFNATVNNISVISCRSDILAKETGGPEEQWPCKLKHCKKKYSNLAILVNVLFTSEKEIKCKHHQLTVIFLCREIYKITQLWRNLTCEI